MEDEDNIGFGLADALSDALKSTIEADSTAATHCCDIIREYAYGYPSGNDQNKFGKLNTNSSNSLTMAKFTMKSADGTLQEVQIPQITMMPLPLLHVKEASFEFDLNMEVVKKESVELNNDDEKENGQAPDTGNGQNNRRGTSTGIRPSAIRRISNATNRPVLVVGIARPANTVQNDQGKESQVTEKSNSSSSTTHVKATIKMEQADLPAGIKTLLQAAANSLTINDNK